MNKYFWDVIINHYFDFRGKATRKQYWFFILWGIVFVVALFVFSLILELFSPILTLITTVIKWAVLFIPSMAIMVRRLRDGGFSPWFILLLVPSYLYLGFGAFLANTSSQTINPMILLGLLGLNVIVLASSIVLLVLLCLPSKNPQENN